MKKLSKKQAVVGLGLSLSLLVGAFASVNIHDNFFKETKAATDVSVYYSSVNGKGSALLSSINSVIKTGTTDVGYNGLWTSYKTTDKRSDGKVYDLYSDKTNFTFGSGQCGNYSDIGDCYNREHTIPKSWWGGDEKKQGSDLYIVLPSDGKVNGMRSNYPYGITTSGTSYKLSGDPDGNRLGDSTNTSYVSGKVFEPFDSRKGDLARVYFYAVARYLDSGAGKGAAKNWTGDDGSKVFSSSGNNGFVQSYLNMLLAWHTADPVSQWEIDRNNNVENEQGNRNPFVDHPSWVDLIWGGTYGSSKTNGENTSSGTVVNGQLASKELSSLSFTGTPTTTSYAPGSIFDPTGLTVTAIYDDASQENVTSQVVWTNLPNTTGTNKSVTGTYTYKNVSKTVTVSGLTVKTVSSLSKSGTLTKTEYIEGQNFNPDGLTITANYSDSSSANITNAVTWTPSPLTAGTTSVTGSYGDKTITVSGITVAEATVAESTAIYTVTSKTEVSTTGTAPTNSSAEYSQTYSSTAGQIPKDNSATLTLSGYDGATITGLVLNMKSNSSSGAGTFSIVCGSTTIAQISSATTFNHWYDNTSYSNSYVDITVDIENDSYEIQENEEVVITISGTTNSLYIKSYSITYTCTSSGGSGDSGEEGGEGGEESANACFEKVTSTSNVTNGKYLIVYETGSVAFNGSLTTLDAVSNTKPVTITDSKISYTSALDAITFTINTSGTIKSSSGYYIGRSSNSNGLESSTSTQYKNTISISDGDAVIKSTSYDCYLRYNSNDGQTRFRYYGNGQNAIQLYKANTAALAESYAKAFNDANVCGTNDNTAAISSVWTAQNTAYQALNNATKSYLTNVDVNDSTTYSSEVRECIERYDMVVYKRGFDNFMNRVVSYDSKKIINIADDGSKIVVLIVSITSLITLSLLCLYVYKRRRYEKDN